MLYNIIRKKMKLIARRIEETDKQIDTILKQEKVDVSELAYIGRHLLDLLNSLAELERMVSDE